MANGLNFLDPMNHSTYLENSYPATYQDALNYGGYLLDKPKLNSQPDKDSFENQDGTSSNKKTWKKVLLAGAAAIGLTALAAYLTKGKIKFHK